MTEEQNSSESQSPQVVNLAHVDVENVHAELVRMHQSLARAVRSEDVELNLSAVAAVETGTMKMYQSLAAAAEAKEMTVSESAVGVVQAETLSHNGASAVVLAGSVEFGNAYAGLVAGREVRGDRIESLILLSPRVEGNVTTVMDTRGALIAGMVGGLFAGIMLLLGRMLFGRR
jgi:hypothetical protein